MLPILGGIMSGLGGLGQLLGALGIGGQNVPYNQINPYFDQTMGMLQGREGDISGDYSRLLRGGEGITNRLGGVQGALGQFGQQMAGVAQPNMEAGYNLFQQRAPGLMDMGRQAAEMYTSPFREQGEQIAGRRASEAVQRVMSSFGGNAFSGAAAGAAGGAAASEMDKYESALAQMYANIGSGIGGQALGAERGFAEAAPQQRFSNAINQLLQQAQMEQARGGSIAQQGGLMNQLAGIRGNELGQVRGALSALSAPNYQAPLQTNPLQGFSTALGGFGDFLGGDFSDLFTPSMAPTGSPEYPKSPAGGQYWENYSAY